MKKSIWIPLVIAVLVAVDQWVKHWIVANFALGEVKTWIKGLVSLTYLQNSGAAFSMLENQQVFFTIVTVLVLGVASWYLYKNIKGSFWMVTSLVLIIAGGIGNFIDRLMQGYVVDMFHLDFLNFAIFNVADAYLSVGVVLLMLVMLKED